MPRVKVKVERGNGLQQVVVIDTSATQGATLGTDVRLPSGQVATPATFLTWLGTAPASGGGGGGSSGPNINSILKNPGDMLTRSSQLIALGIGTQDQALRVSAGGLPEWRTGAALTKTDDTNVTLALGGAPATSLLAAASLTLGWTGQLSETRGGTAQSSYLAGDMLYASALNTLSKLAIGAAGRWLGSSGTAPQWNAPAALTKTDDTNVTLTLGGTPASALLNAASLTAGWTGTLARARGGFGTDISALATGLLAQTASNTWAVRTLTGTSNRITVTNGDGVSGNPTVDVAATYVGQSSITTLGTIGTGVWNGTVVAAVFGGTAQSGYLTGDLLYASALNTLSKRAIGSTGDVLTVAGGIPTWAAPTSGAVGANPTASVGLAAVNGVATTFLRSDGAPALSQSIVPTWSGRHIFSAPYSSGYGVQIASGTPGLEFYDTNAGTNIGKWAWEASTGIFTLYGTKDDYSVFSKAIEFARNSAAAITSVVYGNSTDNPTHTFYGSIIGNLQHNAAAATGAASSGTYTPTLTGVANVDSTTAYVCQWKRVGNVVAVSGKVLVDATTAGVTTQIGVSLPIASALTAQEQLGGSGCGLNLGAIPVSCAADAANDRANFRFVPASTTSEDYAFSFQYLVL